MSLTDAQFSILAADIRGNADPDIQAAHAAGNHTELARLYNEDGAAFIWRPSIPPEEYASALDWTEVDNLSAGKARVWEWATQNQTAPLDATNQNLRAGIAQAFGGQSNTTANLTAIAKRRASIYEGLFIEGNGTEQTPGVATVYGPVNINIIGRALSKKRDANGNLVDRF